MKRINCRSDFDTFWYRDNSDPRNDYRLSTSFCVNLEGKKLGGLNFVEKFLLFCKIFSNQVE